MSEARTIVVDGVRQVYRVAGEGPVCLVHSGGPGIHSDYLRMPALEQHLRMVYLDPVGSGDSDLLPDGNYSTSRYGHFARAVLDDVGAPTAYFLGHSHGGFVALQFALEHPERLDGLILYDTTAWTTELTEIATKEMAAFVERWPDRPEAAEAGRLWEAAMVTHTMEINDNESHERLLLGILPAYFADHRRTDADLPVRVTHDPNRLPGTWDVRDQLGTIDVPALVIVGSYDFICPPRFAYELRDGLPDARLCELSDSGHFGHIEQPAEFVGAVMDFVNGGKR
jgi:pimeloyl-ACP methyl ester carboxylesterase